MNSYNHCFHEVIPKISQVNEGLKGSNVWVTFEPFFIIKADAAKPQTNRFAFLLFYWFPLGFWSWLGRIHNQQAEVR